LSENKSKPCEEHRPVTDHIKGEMVCAKCGLVIGEERLKTELEWKPK
jgi:transcription initiation factor TFIIIB Brf1 subunit/transcription initiation factor TFIIB